mmetsp:Transcript_8375/g.15263  ORF Transcript_8375/g.15263 Transcript_8375/m.15263 type:complete len:329 (-) Transcript_8375:6-992(-)
MQLVQLLTQQQQINSQDQCSWAELAANNIDFVAGMYVGMMAGMMLIPSALSVLGGLAESLYNVKALFPGNQEIPWLLILTSLEALPIYMAFLAVVQQMMGDQMLAIACLSFVLWICLPAITGKLTLNLRAGYTNRWKFYRKVWVEYGLRVPCAIAIGFGVSGFMRGRLGNEFLQERNPWPILIFTTLEYFTRKSLTAVAGTDAATSAFLKSLQWQQTASDEDITCNKERMLSLAPFDMTTGKLARGLTGDISEGAERPGSRGPEDDASSSPKPVASGGKSTAVSPEVYEVHEVRVDQDLREVHEVPSPVEVPDASVSREVNSEDARPP